MAEAAGPPSAPRARVVWVLIDGVGDVGVPSLGRQTPLQVRLRLRGRDASRAALRATALAPAPCAPARARLRAHA